MDEMFDKIKEQAYKAKDGAVTVAKTVIDKTNDIVNKTKIKFSINETKGKIDDLYLEMGKKVYNYYKATGEVSESMLESCTVIDALMDEIETMKQQIAELDEDVICTYCGANNKKDDVYCSKCGKKIYEAFEDEEDDDGVITIAPKKPENDE